MLAKKFLLWLLAPLALLLTGAGILLYKMAASGLQEQVDRNLRATVSSLEMGVAARIDRAKSDLRVLAAHPAFEEYFQFAHFDRLDDADAKLIELQEHFVAVARLKKSCSRIALYDADGRSLVTVDNGERTYVASNASGEAWFHRALNAAGGYSSQNKSETNALVSRVQVDQEQREVLGVFRPLHVRGVARGVLRINVLVARQFGDLFAGQAVGRAGYAYLVGAAGKILVHRDASMVGQDVTDHYAPARALQGYSGVVFRGEDGDDARMREAFHPIQATDLAVVVAIPAAEVFEPIDEMRSMVVPVALLVFVALGLFGIFMVSRVIAPIRQLTRSMSKVGSGDLDVISHVRTKDEIEALSDGFNRMTASLKANREDLRRKTKALITAAEALRESEESLRITLNSIGEGVVATDRAGRITRMNRVAETLSGISADRALGRPLRDVFPLIRDDTREPVPDPVARVIHAGDIVGFTNHTLLRTAEGLEKHIADSGAPIRDADGNIVGVVLVFRDMTERYRIEAQLRQSQKMESIGQLAGGIAHDFNNLLTAISGSAELIGLEMQSNPMAGSSAEMVTTIQTASKQAAELTGQLLQFSRRRAMAFAPTDLHDVVKEVVRMASRTFDKRVEIRTELNARSSDLLAERTALQSAILNLAINARDAMPNGGTLTLSTRRVIVDEAECQRRPGDLEPGPHVELTIADSGTGMDRATCERIFEPFFTTKDPGRGTGLGLSMVYSTVVGHRGSIEVDSDLGVGTRMRILLPLARKEQTMEIDEPEVVRGEGRLLVVDDDLVARRTAQLMLEQLGYEVVAVDSGARGIEVFAPDPGAFDLVLLDMVMPKENGCDVLKKMVEINPQVRVLMISGHVGDGPREEAAALGAKDLLHKPFSMGELSQAVAQWVGSAT